MRHVRVDIAYEEHIFDAIWLNRLNIFNPSYTPNVKAETFRFSHLSRENISFQNKPFRRVDLFC